MRGTGKTKAADRLGDVAELIDVERLQFLAATAIDPASNTDDRYRWEFWTGERLSQLPTALNRAFIAEYGAGASYLTSVRRRSTDVSS